MYIQVSKYKLEKRRIQKISEVRLEVYVTFLFFLIHLHLKEKR